MCTMDRCSEQAIFIALEDTSLLKDSQFRILKKCQGKFNCFVYEMLFIMQRNPCLNTKTDSIRAKLFV